MSWQKELDELARRKALAAQMGGAEKVARHKSLGKLTVRERVGCNGFAEVVNIALTVPELIGWDNVVAFYLFADPCTLTVTTGGIPVRRCPIAGHFGADCGFRKFGDMAGLAGNARCMFVQLGIGGVRCGCMTLLTDHRPAFTDTQVYALAGDQMIVRHMAGLAGQVRAIRIHVDLKAGICAGNIFHRQIAALDTVTTARFGMTVQTGQACGFLHVLGQAEHGCPRRHQVIAWRQNFASLLEKAKTDGRVLIKRKDGSIFAVQPVESKDSPLDVKGVDAGLEASRDSKDSARDAGTIGLKAIWLSPSAQSTPRPTD